MKIGGLQKVSTVDYPGHLCCTVFLSGCNLRCKFCHNPELVKVSDKTQDIDIKEVIDFLEKRKGLLDGVCITGGEPTIHDDLEDLIISIREMGYKIKLDTNGTNPMKVKELIDKELIDYIAVDIKASIDKYEEVTGCHVNTEDIKETIRVVLDSSIDYEFRTTFLPDLDEKDINNIAGYLTGCKRYVVQQFRNNTTLDKEYEAKQPHNPQSIIKVAEGIKEMFEECEVRGVQ